MNFNHSKTSIINKVTKLIVYVVKNFVYVISYIYMQYQNLFALHVPKHITRECLTNEIKGAASEFSQGCVDSIV